MGARCVLSGGPSQAGRPGERARSSTGPLLRHWSSRSTGGSSTDASRELTCLRSSPAFGARWHEGSREAGAGNGLEGRQFAAPGATVARRRRELGRPGGASRAGRPGFRESRPSRGGASAPAECSRPAGEPDVVVGVFGSGSSLTTPLCPLRTFCAGRSPSSRITDAVEGRRREWSGGQSRTGQPYCASSFRAERKSEVNPRPEADSSTSLLVFTTPMTPCPAAGSKAMNERKPPWSPVCPTRRCPLMS